MPSYDYNTLAAPFGQVTRSIADHVMRMPAVRHKLAEESGLRQIRQAEADARIATEGAQARKYNADAALSEDEMTAAKELQAVFSAPDAVSTNANGSLILSPNASASVLGLLARAGTRGRDFGAGSRDYLAAANAPHEAEANRIAANQRNELAVQERAERPVVAGGAVYTPQGRLLTAGIQRLGPDQQLYAPEDLSMKLAATGIPKPTTPRGQAITEQMAAKMLTEGVGTNEVAQAVSNLRTLTAPAATNQPAAAPAPGKPLDEVTAKQILLEAGGDKNKARQIAAQRGFVF